MDVKTDNKDNNPKEEIGGSSKTAEILLDALVDEQVPDELKDRISDWFKNENNADEKYEAFRKNIVSLRPNINPDKYEYDQLAKIHAILGLPEFIVGMELEKRRLSALRKRTMRIAAVIHPFLVLSGVAFFMDRKEYRAERLHNGIDGGRY